MTHSEQIASELFENVISRLKQRQLIATLDFDCAALYESLIMVVEKAEKVNKK